MRRNTSFFACFPRFGSREVTDYWHLAHRTREEIEGCGLDLLTNTMALSIDMASRSCKVRRANGNEDTIEFEQLILGTGARSGNLSSLSGGEPFIISRLFLVIRRQIF
jgi:hypothetical protein